MPTRAVNEDRYLTMSRSDFFPGGKVGVTSAPYGDHFGKMHCLDAHPTGLDPCSIPLLSQLGLYCFDPETRSYKEMGIGELSHNLDKGEIISEDGELPHFFEYAFGYL